MGIHFFENSCFEELNIYNWESRSSYICVKERTSEKERMLCNKLSMAPYGTSIFACYSMELDLAFDVRMRLRLEDLRPFSKSDMVSSTSSALTVGICMVSDDSSWDSSPGSVDVRAGGKSDFRLELLLFWVDEAEAGGVIGEL
jgi:hypothetical protein